MNPESQHQASLNQLIESVKEAVMPPRKRSKISKKLKVCKSKLSKLRSTVKGERYQRFQVKSELRKEQHRRAQAEISDLFHQIEALKSRQEVQILELELQHKNHVIQQFEQQCLRLQKQLAEKDNELHAQTAGLSAQAKKVKRLEDFVNDLQTENKLSDCIFQNEGRSIWKLIKKSKQQQQRLNTDIGKAVEISAQKTSELMGGLGKLVVELRDQASNFVHQSLRQTNGVNSFGSRPIFELGKIGIEKDEKSLCSGLGESLPLPPQINIGPSSCPVQNQHFSMIDILVRSSKTD